MGLNTSGIIHIAVYTFFFFAVLFILRYSKEDIEGFSFNTAWYSYGSYNFVTDTAPDGKMIVSNNYYNAGNTQYLACGGGLSQTISLGPFTPGNIYPFSYYQLSTTGAYLNSTITCSPCPNGTYMRDSRGTLNNNPCLPVPANSTASSDKKNFNCNVGYRYNNRGATYAYNDPGGVCDSCGLNQYSPGGQSSCTNAPSNSTVTSDKSSFTCNAGYGYSVGSCSICPANTYATPSLSPCQACPSTQYSIPGSSSCSSCSQGQYLLNGTTCTTCPVGTYADQQNINSQCISCPNGGTTYNTGATSSSQCLSCNAGQYVSASGCVGCPPGSYTSSSNLRSCTNCQDGYGASSSGSTSCQQCPSGYYSNSSTGRICRICPAGSSCSDATANPVVCPANTFAPSPGATSCLSIPANSTPNTPTGATSYICNSGYGTTTVNGVGGCVQCSPGTASTGAGPCIQCQAGTYAPAGATSCIQTPAGTYSSAGAGTYIQDDPGYFSSAGAGTEVGCLAGSYCPVTQIGISIPCPPGTYCPTGSLVTTPCPPNTHSSTGFSACIPYASDMKSETFQVNQTVTYANAPAVCNALGAQLATMTQLRNATDNGANWGWAWIQEDTANPILSSNPNAITGSHGATMAYPTQPFQASTYGDVDLATTPNGNVQAPTIHTASGVGQIRSGYYSGSPTATANVTCYGVKPPLGTPNISSFGAQWNDPFVCPVGSACSSPTATGIASVTRCLAGKYSTGGPPSTCNICPPGTWSSDGAASCNRTPAGAWSGSNSGSYILDLLGYFSGSGSSSPIQCPAGYSCPDPAGIPQICPAGTASPAGSTVCTTCSSGQYSPSAGSASCTTDPLGGYSGSGSSSYSMCPPGYYCPPGASIPLRCPRGFYGAGSGLSSSACSGSCPPGTYCDYGTASPTSCAAMINSF